MLEEKLSAANRIDEGVRRLELERRREGIRQRGERLHTGSPGLRADALGCWGRHQHFWPLCLEER